VRVDAAMPRLTSVILLLTIPCDGEGGCVGRGSAQQVVVDDVQTVVIDGYITTTLYRCPIAGLTLLISQNCGSRAKWRI
jgi:hypothetical protein